MLRGLPRLAAATAWQHFRRAMANFEALPHAVQLRIFALLPLDTRLRCVEVCRAWRRSLQDPAACWKHLAAVDCSYARFNPYHVLRAGLARTQGQLETLDLSAIEAYDGFVEYTVCPNGGGAQLRELRLGPLDFLDMVQVFHLLEATPQLQRLCVAVKLSEWFDGGVGKFMHENPHFKAVRVHTLGLDVNVAHLNDAQQGVLLAAIRAAVAMLTHAEFEALYVDCDELDDAFLGAIVDMSLAHDPPLRVLGLEQYANWPDLSMQALLRLLRCNALPQLNLGMWSVRLESRLRNTAPDEAEAIFSLSVYSAVRACTSLRAVAFGSRISFELYPSSSRLLSALVEHPCVERILPGDEEDDLEYLDLVVNELQHEAAVYCAHSPIATAVAAALIANSPALLSLSLLDSRLDEADFAHVLRALPRNTHLKELTLGTSEDYWSPEYDEPAYFNPEFIENELLPAVQQNRSLRKLTVEPDLTKNDLAPDTVRMLQKDCFADELLAVRAAVTHVRDRSDPAVQAAARGWQRAYRKWTAPRAQP